MLSNGLEDCREISHVEDVRVLGAIGVVEMKRSVDVADLQRRFVERGIWLRPFGRLVYTMPPYIMEAPDLDLLTAAIVDTLREVAD